jgi:predicted homoserine dehydrogenase-like protein
VITAAKRDLRAGQALHRICRFDCYDLTENADQCPNERLLLMSASEGCRPKRDVERDEIIAVDDIELPHGRLRDRLRREQDLRFASIPLNFYDQPYLRAQVR